MWLRNAPLFFPLQFFLHLLVWERLLAPLLLEGLTLPIWQKHTTVWGICVSCAEPQTIAEPSLRDEGRRAQKAAQKTVMTLLL